MKMILYRGEEYTLGHWAKFMRFAREQYEKETNPLSGVMSPVDIQAEAIIVYRCDYCLVQPVKKNQNYCSNAHKQAAYRDRRLIAASSTKLIPQNETRVCALEGCENTFTVIPSFNGKKLYCCDNHRIKACRQKKKKLDSVT